ncbi:MAG: nucleotidyltransferase family protein [Nanoarchaeota archaeon]|nr:nucleotidyltransferase family protein [Nanoarchaeota archaeon]
MIKRKNIEQIRKMVLPILRRNGVAKAAIFGSHATGMATPSSDVDMLVSFRGRKSLLDLAGVELELEKVLGRKVDLLTYKSLHPLLRERVMKEEVRIL